MEQGPPTTYCMLYKTVFYIRLDWKWCIGWHLIICWNHVNICCQTLKTHTTKNLLASPHSLWGLPVEDWGSASLSAYSFICSHAIKRWSLTVVPPVCPLCSLCSLSARPSSSVVSTHPSVARCGPSCYTTTAMTPPLRRGRHGGCKNALTIMTSSRGGEEQGERNRYRLFPENNWRKKKRNAF